MDRYWLLTSTFYGNWLPGDPRGFVSRVRDERPDDPETMTRLTHNIPGTPYDEDIPGLHGAAEEELKGEPILVNLEQARALLTQFQETSRPRLGTSRGRGHAEPCASGGRRPRRPIADESARRLTTASPAASSVDQTINPTE